MKGKTVNGIISLLRIRNGIKYIVMLLLIAMAGCSNEHATSRKDAPVEVLSAESYELLTLDSESLAFVASGNPGESRFFNNTRWGDSVQIAIVDEYCSALGELCRRLSILQPDGTLAVAVAVQCGNGVWAMVPDISPVQSQPSDFDTLLIGT